MLYTPVLLNANCCLLNVGRPVTRAEAQSLDPLNNKAMSAKLPDNNVCIGGKVYPEYQGYVSRGIRRRSKPFRRLPLGFASNI